MSIVRSLLISIGFQTDKKAINETNRAITGFKTRFAIAATAASYAFKVIAGFFSDIARATLDSDELARSLGISLKELQAMQQVAARFRISPEQLAGAFSTAKKDLDEFAQGFGRLPEILRKLKIEISKDAGPKELFDKYIEAIRGIENEQGRIKVATDLFGDQLGVKIADLSIRYDEFKEAVKEAYAQLEKQPDVLTAAKAYEESVNKLTEAWNRFTYSLSTTVFPVLQKLIEYLTIASDFAKNVFNLDASGIKGNLNAASKLVDPLFKATGLNHVSDFFKNTFFNGQSALNGIDRSTFGKINDYIENKPGYEYKGFLTPPSASMAPITTNIEVNVPSGTQGDQVDFMSDRIKQAVDESIMDTFYRIQNNNPVVE